MGPPRHPRLAYRIAETRSEIDTTIFYRKTATPRSFASDMICGQWGGGCSSFSFICLTHSMMGAMHHVISGRQPTYAVLLITFSLLKYYDIFPCVVVIHHVNWQSCPCPRTIDTPISIMEHSFEMYVQRQWEAVDCHVNGQNARSPVQTEGCLCLHRGRGFWRHFLPHLSFRWSAAIGVTVFIILGCRGLMTKFVRSIPMQQSPGCIEEHSSEITDPHTMKVSRGFMFSPKQN
jgi:hypothetical protein